MNGGVLSYWGSRREWDPICINRFGVPGHRRSTVVFQNESQEDIGALVGSVWGKEKRCILIFVFFQLDWNIGL